jgi:hypothetical protein
MEMYKFAPGEITEVGFGIHRRLGWRPRTRRSLDALIPFLRRVTLLQLKVEHWKTLRDKLAAGHEDYVPRPAHYQKALFKKLQELY